MKTTKEKEKEIEALNIAYKMEKMAIESKTGCKLEAIPYHWVFEEFCKDNGIKQTFDSIDRRYILTFK